MSLVRAILAASLLSAGCSDPVIDDARTMVATFLIPALAPATPRTT